MKIVTFLPNWIGDVVMATPALRALQNRFPGAEMIGVCKPYVAPLLGGNPWFHKLLFMDTRGSMSQCWPGTLARLRPEKPDLAILFPNTFRSAFVAKLAGCKRIVGFRRYFRGWLLTDALDPLKNSGGQYEPTPVINDYNRLVETAGCSWPGHRMELFTTAEDECKAQRIWDLCQFQKAPEVVCLNPGAAFGASKYWDVEHFARLAQDLTDRRGSGILILCGPSEREIARQIARLAGRPTVHSLADAPVSLGLTKALVRRSNLLVTTDSGPRHFAAAFDRPVVTLFGPTHIAWTETYFPKAIHLQKKVPCGPCQKRLCPLDHRCMKDLLPEEVFRAATDLLDRTALPQVSQTATLKAS